MNAKKYQQIIEWFEVNMPIAESELDYKNPYQLLCAVILSAQATDKRVNMITPKLFERFPTPEDMAASSEEEIYLIIRSITYPNSKARHLLGMARMLVSDFGSVVPEDVEELQKLPGVGRKTANVIASIVYNKPVIAVDTHVFRTSRRLGLSSGKNVLEVEKDLTAVFPENLRAKAHHWLILHGRYLCTARKQKCESCGLAPFCDYFNQSDNS
jgi:endonuclease-3